MSIGVRQLRFLVVDDTEGIRQRASRPLGRGARSRGDRWADERRAALQQLGVTTVLQKPLRTQQLRELIAERISGSDG